MSSISDEIRTWCGGVGTVKDLRALADRIDQEMVELPRDCDGVPIHVGDTMYGCRSGMKMTISELRMTANGWSISTSRGYLTDAELTHTRPDSWERIARDIEEPAFSDCEDTRRERREIAERIRKLAKKEGER